MTSKTSPIKSIQDLFAKTAQLELKDIEGNGTGIILTLVGTDSRQFREASKKVIPFRGKKATDLTAEEITNLTDLSAEMIINLIVGWNNDTMFGGPYSPEYAKTVLQVPEAKFVLDQVEAYVTDRTNFFYKSKGKSVKDNKELHTT